MPICKNCHNLYNLSDDDDKLVGKWCPKINDSPHTDIERDCDHYNPMTNGDMLRSCTDEELAAFLSGYAFSCNEQKYNICLEWLKEESKVQK